MEVIVHITPDDYWHFNKTVMRRQIQAKKPPWVLLLILGGVVLILAGVLSLLRGDFTWISELTGSWIGAVLRTLLIIAGACVVLLVLVFWVTKRFIKKQGSEDSGATGEHQIRITADGIHEKTVTSEGFHKWTAVTELSQDNEYIFLFVGKARAHIVPKREFTDSQKAAAFFEKSLELWKSATP